MLLHEQNPACDFGKKLYELRKNYSSNENFEKFDEFD